MDTPRSSYPTFSWTEHRRLLRALAQAHDARLYRRLRAVAEIAEGEPVAVVAKHARVERSTVYRGIERYLAERAPSALVDAKRSGRPRMTPALTDDKLRQLLTSDPCKFGYDANTWTVPLLATHLGTQGVVISAAHCGAGSTPPASAGSVRAMYTASGRSMSAPKRGHCPTAETQVSSG
jgi:transposase